MRMLAVEWNALLVLETKSRPSFGQGIGLAMAASLVLEHKIKRQCIVFEFHGQVHFNFEQPFKCQLVAEVDSAILCPPFGSKGEGSWCSTMNSPFRKLATLQPSKCTEMVLFVASPKVHANPCHEFMVNTVQTSTANPCHEFMANTVWQSEPPIHGPLVDSLIVPRANAFPSHGTTMHRIQ